MERRRKKTKSIKLTWLGQALIDLAVGLILLLVDKLID